ncbi:2'-5' RNA ligase family protein [Flavobacterium caeni]|uniref:2'-5' RNA ligase superfamily protein n=1 Tax=Flavobacterium caeni TaxID=490189 RepID=A0A1G5JQH0_9FLAO|nr:2'-5' RNA ligase family protein [Flavobacterium caeni]SCY90672.1 2'-5' RNA ligase superfamily protein [Flavobacterium caeni]
MVHIPEYSLVIRPPQPIIETVAELKKRLRAEIGWFGSANSQAHVTVFNFDATPDELPVWKDNISQFCETIIPQEVVFDHFDAFPPRTFFIAPDGKSMRYLNEVIVRFSRFIKVKPQAHAHLSVARSLKEGQLEQAKNLFTDEPLYFEFLCDALTLRQFDHESKQYANIIGRFAFTGTKELDLLF